MRVGNMIYKTLEIDKLYSSHRWNAEFFLNSSAPNEAKGNYPIVSLKDILDERKEFIEPQEYLEHTFNYIGLENISQNTRDIVGFEPKKGSEIKSRSKIFREGDLLYGRLRPILNKAFLNSFLFDGICSSEIFVLVANKERVNPAYLIEVLISPIILDKVGFLTAGAALPRIQIKDFLNLQIPLPPQQIQQEIAETAEKYRIEAHALMKKAQKIHTSLPDALLSAVEQESPFLIDFNQIEDKINYLNPLPGGSFETKRRNRSQLAFDF
jgi:hypothetical protein